MKTIGYLRISTIHQDSESQKYSILQKFKCETFVTEQVSGKVSWKDRELGKLIKGMGCGDTLIVAELSRLGRSFYEVMELLSVMSQRGIRLHSIKENFDLSDSIQIKVVAFAFSLAAEIERQLISQRTKEALASKKAQGVVLGRPKDSKDSYKRVRKTKDYG